MLHLPCFNFLGAGDHVMTRANRTLWCILAIFLLPQVAYASGASETFTRTTILLILLITLADWCGFLFERLGLPELIGEICAGIVLGNLALVGIDFNVSEMLRTSEFMQYASELGVILLLFLVGMESDIKSLLKVGRNAVSVAFVGVALPVLMGLGACAVIGLGSGLEGWFIGAMLAATSVGITAKILAEQNLLQSKSAEVIVGAAVIDDILGILLLAVLASIALTGDFSGTELLWIVSKALAFLVLAVLAGQLIIPRLVSFTALNNHTSFWIGSAICLALTGAQLAAFAGLAPLIGAFLVGLLLDEVHFIGKGMEKHTLEKTLKPAADILLTIFFVSIGSKVQLETLVDPKSLLIIGTLFIVAVISKGAAGLVVTGKDFDKLGVGIGMIPRGEVGLVFATFAFSHGVFDAATFSALVMVVLLTTMAGPILLKSRLSRF